MALNAQFAPPELSTATKHRHHAARAPQAKPAAMALLPASNAVPPELFSTACQAARSALLEHTAKPPPAAVRHALPENGARQALPNALWHVHLQKVERLPDICVQKLQALLHSETERTFIPTCPPETVKAHLVFDIPNSSIPPLLPLLRYDVPLL